MKTIIPKISLLLLIILILSSCKIDIKLGGISGNRNVVTEQRKISNNFTQIRASNGLDIYITQDKKTTVVVEADENLQNIIKTEVINGVLKIYSDKNIRRAKAKKIYVSAPSIDGVTATSGSNVVSENTLKSTHFEAKSTSGANLKLIVDATDITSKSTSGANLRLSGQTIDYTANASSGSNTKSYDLKCKNVTVKVSSGANIDVFASNSIIAKATSGEDIGYKGNPIKAKIKSSSGGSISAH